MNKKNKIFIVLYYIGAFILGGLYLSLGTAISGEGYIPFIDENTLAFFFASLIAFYAASYLIREIRRISVWSVLSLFYLVAFAFMVFSYFYANAGFFEVYSFIAITSALTMCFTAFFFLYFSFFLVKDKKLKNTNIYLPAMFIVFVIFIGCICFKFNDVIFYEGMQYPYFFYVANFAFLIVSLYAVGSLGKKDDVKATAKKTTPATKSVSKVKKTAVKKTTKKPVKKTTKK